MSLLFQRARSSQTAGNYRKLPSYVLDAQIQDRFDSFINIIIIKFEVCPSQFSRALLNHGEQQVRTDLHPISSRTKVRLCGANYCSPGKDFP